MSLVWSYGITTIPERFEKPYGETSYLYKTIHSLASAGFPDPHLFVDGPTMTGPTGYTYTIHGKRLRTFGNWVLSAWELYLREPKADRFAIFQDDFICYKNLREYLDSCQYPENGYLNLYLFPMNERDGQVGWYKSNQMGKGAVALVFDRIALQTLLCSADMVLRPTDTRRGWRNVDGGIITAMKKAGFSEYVHSPSLIQHIGDVSSMENPMHEKASTFLGENFDALQLPAHEPRTIREVRRIGLSSYNCVTPEDQHDTAWHVATHLDIQNWLVKPHPYVPMREPHPDIDSVVCRTGQVDKMEKFLRGVDVVLTVGPPRYTQLFDLCDKFRRRVVCIPTGEELHEWAYQVNLFLCFDPELYTRYKDKFPCAYVPRPKDDREWKLLADELNGRVRIGDESKITLV